MATTQERMALRQCEGDLQANSIHSPRYHRVKTTEYKKRESFNTETVLIFEYFYYHSSAHFFHLPSDPAYSNKYLY